MRTNKKMRWNKFTQSTTLKERRCVLVQIAEDPYLGMPPSVAVGYLRKHSDGKFFVIPGFGRNFVVTHWCDCLSDDFHAPLWKNKIMNLK